MNSAHNKLTPAERRQVIYLWHRGGKTMAALGALHGVSKQAINYILRSNGVPKANGKRPRFCKELDCGLLHYAMGWCRRHYQRWCYANRPEFREAMCRAGRKYRAGLRERAIIGRAPAAGGCCHKGESMATRALSLSPAPRRD